MLKTRIMVFGTFDVLHKGHLNFFKQARQLAKHPYLIVSIARDVNVKRIKGKKPENNEQLRKRIIAGNKYVDKTVFGGKKNYLDHIIKQAPQIIALGYDQKAYVKNLKKDLAAAKLNIKIIRLKPFKASIYKSSIIKKLPKT